MRREIIILLVIIFCGGFFYCSNLVLAEKNRGNQRDENNNSQNQENNSNEKNQGQENQGNGEKNEGIEDKSPTIPSPSAPEIERGDLVINEFLPNPDGELEWIEIFNTTDKDFDLNDCEIRDARNNEFGSLSGIIESGNYLVTKDSRVLNDSGGDVIILSCGEEGKKEIDKVIYGKTYRGKSFSRIPNGEGDFIILDNSTKGEINNYSPVAVAGDDQEVFVNEKVDFVSNSYDRDWDRDIKDILVCSWDFGDGSDPTEPSDKCETFHVYADIGTYTVTLTVSDGKEESTDTLTVTVNPITYSDQIVINEFLPDPEGSDTTGEWIELYNKGSEDVDLTDWQLDDGAGGSKAYTFPKDATIKAKRYLVVYRTESGIALNNNGDSVWLFQPDGNLLDSVKYDDSDTGVSYNRVNGDWKWSTKLTPGAKNIIEELEDEEAAADEESVEDEEIKEISISDAKKQEKGTKVKVQGVVAVPPGVFSDKVFYIAGSGIQVYCYQGFPTLEIGDKVSLIGYISSYYNEVRIRVTSGDNIEVIGQGNEPKPHKVKTGEVNEGLEGSLIKTGGTVTRSAGRSFYINDGSGDVRVYIDKDTEIVKPKLKKGDYVSVIGVVSETSSGYRILPRFQSDFKLVKAVAKKSTKSAGKKKLAGTGANVFEPILTSFLLTILVVYRRKVL